MMDLETAIALASALAVAIPCLFTLMQWLGTVRIRRAEMVKSLLDEIRANPDMSDAWYFLEYHEESNWYDDSFHQTDIEKKMDRLLAHLTYVCYLIDRKVLRKQEAELFDYQIRSVSKNIGLQSYFFNLYHFAHRNGTDCSFEQLLNYSKSKGFLPDYFFDKDCGKYCIVSFNVGYMDECSGVCEVGIFNKQSEEK